MKKRGIWTAIILLGMVLCGCGMSAESDAAVSAEQEIQGEKDFRETGNETAETETQTPDEAQSGVSLWGQDMYASAILEDEDALYFVGKDHIRRIAKASGEEEFIWKSLSEENENVKQTYASYGGILILDRIYFIERWKQKENTDEWNYALSAVGTDGSGYERIQVIQQ